MQLCENSKYICKLLNKVTNDMNMNFQSSIQVAEVELGCKLPGARSDESVTKLFFLGGEGQATKNALGTTAHAHNPTIGNRGRRPTRRRAHRMGVRAHAQGNDEKAHGSQRLAPGLTLMAGSAHWLRSVVGWRSVLIASGWQNGVARESTSLHFFVPFD